MKKIITVIFFLIAMQSAGYAQDPNAESPWRDSALHGLDTARQDTTRVLLLVELAAYYTSYLPDSVLFYGYKALGLARKIKFPEGEVAALRYIMFAEYILGNYSKALQITLQALKIAERNKVINYKAILLSSLGKIHNELGNHTKALELSIEAKALFDSLHDFSLSAYQQNVIGETYLTLNQPDSALYYCQSAHEAAIRLNDWVLYNTLMNLGKIQLKKGDAALALTYFRQALSNAGNPVLIFDSYFSIAQLYREINKPDSCIYYARKSLEIIQGRGFYLDIIKANLLLSTIYERRDPQKALQYSRMATSYKDSLFNLEKRTSFENLLAFDEQERQYEIETAKAAYRSQVRQYAWMAGVLVFLLVAFIFYRINKIRMQHEIVLQKHKTSELEMQALRAQMNPHFIFNSLNSINMFILENNRLQASEYLSKFSRLVRLILQNSKEPFIPLESELEALQLYLELESLRFEHKFEHKISVNNDVDTTVLKVPPLIIQPYAENAIWHGLMHLPTQQACKRERGHLEIELYQQDKILICKITDDGIGRKKAAELKSKSSTHKSMGINITESRIAMMQVNGFTKSVEIRDLVYADGTAAGTEVVLKIPVMQQT